MSDFVPKSDLMLRLVRLNESAEQEQLQSDAELLSLYVDGGNREALERLIWRYAPMVASVCRLTVSDVASAEDAFQATFLIFLKSAKKIRKQASVAAWLHGVAYRTASRIRRKIHQPAAIQSHNAVIKQCGTNDDPIAQLARKMELEALDRELQRLPERLRAPLVEHYLLGYSAPEIAERMELSTSAVEGRLRRGRRQLRTRLAKRGISLSVLLAGSALFKQHLAAAEAFQWTAGFMSQHVPVSAADGSAADTVNLVSLNPEVSSLVNGELSMLSTTTLKASLAAGILIIAGTLAVIAADQDLTGSAAGGSVSSPVVTLTAPDREHQVLAQFGGVQPAAGEEAVANVQATAGSGIVGMGLSAQPAKPPEIITWQQPETNAGEQPIWLAGGTASMRAMEENRAVLAQEVVFDFEEIPLRNLAAWLTDETGMQFEVRTAELENYGVDPDEPISIHGTGSVRELLRRILDPLELTYRVTESTIELTSIDAATENPTIRFYDLSYVLPNDSYSQAVLEAIKQTADPGSWTDDGGSGSLALVGSTMIVGARDTTHQKIEVILLNLSKMNRKNVEKAPVPAVPVVGGFGGGGMGGSGGFGGGGMGGAAGGGGMF